jgi:hypothetical protein
MVFIFWLENQEGEIVFGWTTQPTTSQSKPLGHFMSIPEADFWYSTLF